MGCASSLSPTNTPAVCLAAQRKGLTQDVHVLHFCGFRGGGQASVGKGRAPESGFPEGPVLWLRYENTWYQIHTRAHIDCQESMASHQSKAKMLETAVRYLESLCFLKSGS